MEEMIESIKANGLLMPILVRKNEEGKYEIISGHRRVHACKKAGIEDVPVIIKDCTREEAIILMVDSNFQRDIILPCEKGLAYKMKKEALLHQGKRTNLTSCQLGTKLENPTSVEKIANEASDSARTIHRLIRLTELNPEIQKIVNESKMGITPAVELSYFPSPGSP